MYRVLAAIFVPQEPGNTANTTSDRNQIQFFPEGGNTVVGVATTISFKAENEQGKGIQAKGFLVSNKGDTAARFTTTHMGMGSFDFTPSFNKQYKAFISYNNAPYVEATFPTALSSGFVLNVINTDSSGVQVSIAANTATLQTSQSSQVNLVARRAGKSYFKQQVTLVDGKAIVAIPTVDFPMGIANITLYDFAMRPVCERLVFVENNNSLQLEIKGDKLKYKSKEQSTFNIKVSDKNGQPVQAFLSLAVVDENRSDPSIGNIYSHLLLESEVKGNVEKPAAYFDKTNPARKQQLDLLLRTQGWRSFLWRQIADTAVTIRYLPEAGITIEGTVTKALSKKPLENMNITLFAPSAKGNKIYLTKTNAEGKYFLDGLPLYGMQTVKLNVGDGIGKTIGAITMDSLYNNQLPVLKRLYNRADTSGLFKSFAVEAAKRWSIFKDGQSYNLLPEVKVKTRTGTTILRDGSVAVGFGYPEYDFQITPKDYEFQRLRDFIVNKVPEARYDDELEGVQFLSNGKPVRPVLMVNKQQDVFGRLDYYSLDMRQINAVSVRHLVGSTPQGLDNIPAADEEGNSMRTTGIRDFFIVTLDIKRGNFDQQLSMIKADIDGYYESRLFYAPNYAKEDISRQDNRTTIYWEPRMSTDNNGNAKFTFYNADPKGKKRINLQGITSTGSAVFAEAVYTVE